MASEVTRSKLRSWTGLTFASDADCHAAPAAAVPGVGRGRAMVRPHFLTSMPSLSNMEVSAVGATVPPTCGGATAGLRTSWSPVASQSTSASSGGWSSSSAKSSAIGITWVGPPHQVGPRPAASTTLGESNCGGHIKGPRTSLTHAGLFQQPQLQLQPQPQLPPPPPPGPPTLPVADAVFQKEVDKQLAVGRTAPPVSSKVSQCMPKSGLPAAAAGTTAAVAALGYTSGSVAHNAGAAPHLSRLPVRPGAPAAGSRRHAEKDWAASLPLYGQTEVEAWLARDTRTRPSLAPPPAPPVATPAQGGAGAWLQSALEAWELEGDGQVTPRTAST